MIKEAQHNLPNSSESADKEEAFIQDRPSLYSVEKGAGSQRSASESPAFSYRDLVTAPTSDDRSMIEKLKNEIVYLEKWMSHHKGSRPKSALSVTNTIRALIATRRSLLETLERRIKKSQ